MAIKRSSGILLPIASLPSPYGIGTLGKSAYEFIDFLSNANQTYWQILPVGPTSFGDSPYQSFSTFAGNPYFIDLDMLIEQNLLSLGDVESINWGDSAREVDYKKVYDNRFIVLRKAFDKVKDNFDTDFQVFVEKNAFWVHEYSLYMAIKEHFDMKSWLLWEDEDIRLFRPEAVKKYRQKLSENIAFYEYLQFLFYSQWKKLRAYAKEKGISIIGDIPIYVAMDSADVWANKELFQINEEGIPTSVAGVPPDYFTENGQLWGNPLYNFDRMKQDGFSWWKKRIEGASKIYDVIRIDHFRAFAFYWRIPYDAKTAKKGEWVLGPRMDLVNIFKNEFKNIDFIAEDLGFLTPDVIELQKKSGFPGMKVLEFAFDEREPSNYLPHTYTENSVCYIGTHDNMPIMAWKDEAAPEDVKFAREYLDIKDDLNFNWAFIRAGMASVSKLFVVQIQDYLGYGPESRINIPGTVGGNWKWRILNTDITKELTKKIARVTQIYGRSNKNGKRSN
ncbi:MAG: 4-alpha-glucanotransferase [Ruminococcaceae bacterium]|nr:4-alpha-glucanotransferase [Oscillospiraceae bacterium]